MAMVILKWSNNINQNCTNTYTSHNLHTQFMVDCRTHLTTVGDRTYIYLSPVWRLFVWLQFNPPILYRLSCHIYIQCKCERRCCAECACNEQSLVYWRHRSSYRKWTSSADSGRWHRKWNHEFGNKNQHWQDRGAADIEKEDPRWISPSPSERIRLPGRKIQ